MDPMTNAATTSASAPCHFGFDGFARTEGDPLPSLLTTEQVAAWFVAHCNFGRDIDLTKLEVERNDVGEVRGVRRAGPEIIIRAKDANDGVAACHPTWAPAARASFARCPIAGDVLGSDRRRMTTPDWAMVGWDDGASYDWYDLDDLGEDEIVWRVTCKSTLYTFRRVADNGGWLGRRVEDCDLDQITWDIRDSDRSEAVQREIAWEISDGRSVGRAVAVAADLGDRPRPVSTATETRWFTVGDVLSLILGRNLAPDGIEGTCRFLDYIAGTGLHPLDGAVPDIVAAIQARHPELRGGPSPAQITELERVGSSIWIEDYAKAHGLNEFYEFSLDEFAEVAQR